MGGDEARGAEVGGRFVKRLAFLLAVAAIIGRVSPASAHPMGNVSISHYAGIEIGPTEVDVKYLLDFAEIPSVRELDRVDPDHDDLVTPEERQAYLDAREAEILPQLKMEINGETLELQSIWSHVSFPPGEGGLSTVRIAWQLRGELEIEPGSERSFLVWSDSNFPNHDGWKEVRFAGVGAIGIGRTSLKRDLRSGELDAYPEEFLLDPPRDTKGWCHFGPGLAPPADTPGGREAIAGDGAPVGFGESGGEHPLVGLITAAGGGTRVIVLSLLLAFVLGAGHALEPGHGKTVVAAYLVGSRGTVAQAVLLGIVVTVTHTFSVFLLGGGVLLLSQWFVPERLYPWLGLVSGLLIGGVGITMLRARLRERAALEGPGHAHEHDHGHAHDHAHSHSHGDRPHSHVPAGQATLGGILALGISGGLVPCPAGIVVLLSAVALGRIAFGLALITAFSLGLAAILIAVGVMFVVARGFFERLPIGGLIVNRLGAVSAVLVTVFGILLAGRSLIEAGILGG